MTAGALNVGSSIYVAKLNAAGSALVFGATFGGSHPDSVTGVAADSAGNVYVTGVTYSNDFPTTPNAVVKDFTGLTAFTVKLNAAGTAFLYATLGNNGDQSFGLALDPSGNAQISGGGARGLFSAAIQRGWIVHCL